jgi:hypothetical protein
MSLTAVIGYEHPGGWSDPARAPRQARHYCERLEAGAILFFPRTPFAFPDEHRRTLLTRRQSGSSFHKNVSYAPRRDLLRGAEKGDSGEARQLQKIMRDYSATVTEFLGNFLMPYAGKFKLEYASYRPVEEAGRQLALHKRNDLLHVDAFPTRPTGGGRILRVFTNLNPSKAREWVVSDGFEWLAEQYAEEAGLERVARRSGSVLQTVAAQATMTVRRLFGKEGAAQTAYDRLMHHFHNYMKENCAFQESCPRYRHSFPPGSTWLVYTDYVPHAVLTGQYALEQTFIIPVEAQVTPERAPVRILEQICGRRLAA